MGLKDDLGGLGYKYHGRAINGFEIPGAISRLEKGVEHIIAPFKEWSDDPSEREDFYVILTKHPLC